jgi:hypothetical protein
VQRHNASAPDCTRRRSSAGGYLRRRRDGADLRDFYRNDITAVDTMIGLFAENCPPGSASPTPFRIFILMASRRIQSDRF